MTIRQAIDLDNYAGKHEAVTVRRIVRMALAKGWTISVFDGEEWTVKKSRDRMTVLKALASTGEDALRFRDADGNSLGTMTLIYQGGDNPGEEVVQDHSDTDAMNALYAEAVVE